MSKKKKRYLKIEATVSKKGTVRLRQRIFGLSPHEAIQILEGAKMSILKNSEPDPEITDELLDVMTSKIHHLTERLKKDEPKSPCAAHDAASEEEEKKSKKKSKK